VKNPDRKREELKAALQAALSANDEEQATNAFAAMAEHMQDCILDEARNMTSDMLSDHAILASRGVHQLTAAEKKYYNAVISGNNGDGSAFAGAEQIPPPTIITRVFDYLRQEHEILNLINLQSVGAAVKFWVRSGDAAPAFWRGLNKPSQELIAKGFVPIDMGINVLTCFLPVHKDMLQLGPEWLDRYVREVLAEAMALGLEEAIVDGSGNNMPIGITRDMTTSTGGAYPRKAARAITDFQPVTLGTHIMAPLTRNGKRKVRDVILVVNPEDYWCIVYGATTILPLDGQYLHGVLPIPAKFVQSAAMPKGLMAAGMAKDYFMGAGFRTGIITSDEHRFIDRERIYLTEIAANGKPLDDDSFLLFDISGVLPQLNPTINMNAAGSISGTSGAGGTIMPAGGTIKQLNDFAAANGIEIPAHVTKRDDIETFIADAITSDKS
jgi:hypothetical protein